MLRVGFEPTFLVFERGKTVHSVDREFTVISDNRSPETRKSQGNLEESNSRGKELVISLL
jgi:hypothetical protein